MVNLNKRDKQILSKVKQKMNISDAGKLYVETNTVAQAKSKAANLKRNGYKTTVKGRKVYVK